MESPAPRSPGEHFVYPALRKNHPVRLCSHTPQAGHRSCPTPRHRLLQDRAPQRPPPAPPTDHQSPGPLPQPWESWGLGRRTTPNHLGRSIREKKALPEQLGQHKQIGPENQGSHKRRDLILKEDNISSLVPLNQHNYAEAFADSPPASLYPSPRYCSIGNNLISGGRRAGRERGRHSLLSRRLRTFKGAFPGKWRALLSRELKVRGKWWLRLVNQHRLM